jgi:ADP-ribose pyrophosphatase YjhB (NUDIX family)
MENIKHDKDSYFVAVKIFLVDDQDRFLITKDIFNDGWDIPGGRLKDTDFETPLESIVERKIREELGDKIQYKLGDVLIHMRHERDEVFPSGEKSKRRIFALGYQAKYLGGEIQLGKHHEKYEWVPIDTFIPENYFTGGWLKGVKDFQAKFKELK